MGGCWRYVGGKRGGLRVGDDWGEVVESVGRWFAVGEASKKGLWQFLVVSLGDGMASC